MKKMIFLIALLAMPLIVSAQKKTRISFEGGGGVSFSNPVVHEFGFSAVFGHRATESFCFYGGFGFLDTVKHDAVSIPVFARSQFSVHTRYLDPFIGADMGYAFFIPTAYSALYHLKINNTALDYVWYEKGYGTRQEYQIMDTEPKRIFYFSNGERTYIPEEQATYGREGIFATLNLGARVHIPGIERAIELSVRGGFAQYYHGCIVKTQDNKKLRYGKTENLAGEQGPLIAKRYTYTLGGLTKVEEAYVQTRGEKVLIEGNESFKDRFKPVLSTHLSFEF